MLVCPITRIQFLKEQAAMNNYRKAMYQSIPSQNDNLHFQLWKRRFNEYCRIVSEWRKKWRRWIILFEHKYMILKHNNHLKKLERRRKEKRSRRRNFMRRINRVRNRN